MAQFKFDLSAIMDAANNDPELFSTIVKEFRLLQDMMKQIQNERSERLQKEAREKHLKAVQDALGGTRFWLTSNNWPDVPYGSELIKTRRGGRTYVYCRVPILGKEGGKVEYKVPPHLVAFTKPDESTIRTNNGLRRLLSNI